jgi:two-component system cell cycle response regulator
MACTARLLVVDSASSELRAIADKLDNEGFESFRANSDDEALALADEARPDIVIIGATLDDRAIALGTTIRNAPSTRHLPVLLMGADLAPGDAADNAEFLPRVSNEAELISRLHSLTRMTTMQTELGRRAETAGKYGIEMPHEVDEPNEVSDAKVLLLGGGSDALAAALAGTAHTSACESPFEAVDRLNAGGFDAVVAEVQPGDDSMLEFCADVRSNARLHNTPILLVAEPERFAEPAEPFRAGASDVIYRPLGDDDLRTRTRALVRQQRYRQAMQKTYREALHIATSDSLTGLYSHGFLHEHLRGQVDDAVARNKHLSIGFFDVAGMAALNAEHGYAAGDQLLRQIGRLIGFLVRGEDLAARYEGEEFCVVLPETSESEAVFALHRIAGVINYTEFALPGTDQPVGIKLEVGSATLEPGDTPETLISRARASLA